MKEPEKFQCPICKSISSRRVERKWWMRLIPESKNYLCKRCHSKFIIIFGDKLIVLNNTLKAAGKKVEKAAIPQDATDASEPTAESASEPRKFQGGERSTEPAFEEGDLMEKGQPAVPAFEEWDLEGGLEKQSKTEDEPTVEFSSVPKANITTQTQGKKAAQEVKISADKLYYIRRLQLLDELKDELSSWWKRRFWIILVIALIIGFFAVRAFVYYVLDKELREAREGRRIAEQLAQDAVQAKSEAETRLVFYEEKMQQLEGDAQRSQGIIADLERQLRMRRSSSYPVSHGSFAPSGDVEREIALEETAPQKTKLSGVEEDSAPADDTRGAQERLQENATFTVLVVSNENLSISAVDKFIESLRAKRFQTSSAQLAEPQAGSDEIEIRYTLDAVEKVKEIRQMLVSTYTDLGQSMPKISMRFGFPNDASVDSQKGKYIRILFMTGG